MIIWRTKLLAKELASGTMSEYMKMKYLLVSTVLYLILGYFSIYPEPVINGLYYSEFVIVVIINMTGVYYCFKCNGGSQGKHYLERFICIAVPATLRCHLIFWGVFVLFFRLVEPDEIKIPPELVIDLVPYFTVICIEIVFYILVARGIGMVRKYEKLT